MASGGFYGSRKTPSSFPCTRPNKRQHIDVGEAIRLSHQISDEDLNFSGLSESEDDFGSSTGSENMLSKSTESPFSDSMSSEEMYTFDHSTPSRTSPAISSGGRTSHSNSSSSHLVDLIQRQNHLITELLSKNDTLVASLDDVKRDLKETRSDVNKLKETQEKLNRHTDAPTVGQKPKRKYPSSLTVIVTKVHDSGEKQFDPVKSVCDSHNVSVKVFIRSEILASHSGVYGEEQISLAIQRLYESRRRAYLNSKPENLKRAQDSEVKKKLRARRERLFVRRSKHVPQKIRKNWDKLNLHYMSEEEDTENGDNKILVKKLPWRSDKLNDLILKLDAAADTAAKKASTFTPERMERIVSGSPSKLSPPPGAPDWALKPEFRKGNANKENEQ